MKILIDTDILLDIILDRPPFADPACQLLDLAQKGEVDAYVAWHSVANLHYISAKKVSEKTSRAFLKNLFSFAKIAPVVTADLFRALSLNTTDFEDAMQAAAALACGAEMIATRNLRDYVKSPVKAYAPKDVLKQI
jgi:predicted nucleic acid-binding protein